MKRDRRINVRATEEMVDKLGGIKCFIGSISDSETLEFILEYITSNEIDFRKLRKYYKEEFSTLKTEK